MHKISIIIPSYNQGAFIGRTIESIIAQKDPCLEIIVMDGGSTDNTIEVLNRYRDKIHILISEKDEGQSDALNKGYHKATGDFIGWQNSDDVYLPGSFQKFRAALNKDTDDGRPSDVYYGNQLVIDSEDHPLFGKIFGPFDKNYLFYVGWNITNQSSFFRKSKIEEIGGFDPSLQFAMDFDFYVRLALGGAQFHWIDSYLGGFRIHELSKGSTMQSVRSKEYVTLRKKYIPAYNENLDWNKQFQLIRLSLYLKRLAFLLMNKNFMQGIIGKFFPNLIRVVGE
jgi:glycosyltransferase involved in cell wall biosynthesis